MKKRTKRKRSGERETEREREIRKGERERERRREEGMGNSTKSHCALQLLQKVGDGGFRGWRIQGPGSMLQGLWCRVQGSGCKI